MVEHADGNTRAYSLLYLIVVGQEFVQDKLGLLCRDVGILDRLDHLQGMSTLVEP